LEEAGRPKFGKENLPFGALCLRPGEGKACWKKLSAKGNLPPGGPFRTGALLKWPKWVK